MNLKTIQAKRQLIIHDYQSHVVTKMQDGAFFTKSLAIPDVQLCQFVCDQDRQCQHFIYAETMHGDYTDRQCYFYQFTHTPENGKCEHCIAYEKKTVLKSGSLN
jgi:hypothetical protein